MKPAALLAASAALAVLAGASAAALLRPAPASADTARADEIARLASALDALAAQQRELRSSLDAFALQAGTANARTEISGADIDAAVARWLDEHGSPQTGAPALAAAPVAAAQLDTQDLFEQLLDKDLSQDDREALWKKAREAGKTDELIKLFEQFAAARPNDPDAQTALGSAYLQKIFEVGNGPEAGLWANKADKAFDAALAIDSNHWESRFSKAISLSFWPPMFGKQAEAINHFQTLIAQQEKQQSKPEFAQTYLWLGNLYLQQGKSDLAKETYQGGLKNFPQDKELLKQLGLVQ